MFAYFCDPSTLAISGDAGSAMWDIIVKKAMLAT